MKNMNTKMIDMTEEVINFLKNCLYIIKRYKFKVFCIKLSSFDYRSSAVLLFHLFFFSKRVFNLQFHGKPD